MVPLAAVLAHSMCFQIIFFAFSSLNSHFGSAVMTKKYGIILNNFLDAYDHAVDGLLPKHGINNVRIISLFQ